MPSELTNPGLFWIMTGAGIFVTVAFVTLMVWDICLTFQGKSSGQYYQKK
jgi:hypothetical protein